MMFGLQAAYLQEAKQSSKRPIMLMVRLPLQGSSKAIYALFIIWVCLDTAYFVETENLLLKVIYALFIIRVYLDTAFFAETENLLLKVL